MRLSLSHYIATDTRFSQSIRDNLFRPLVEVRKDRSIPRRIRRIISYMKQKALKIVTTIAHAPIASPFVVNHHDVIKSKRPQDPEPEHPVKRIHDELPKFVLMQEEELPKTSDLYIKDQGIFVSDKDSYEMCTGTYERSNSVISPEIDVRELEWNEIEVVQEVRNLEWEELIPVVKTVEIDVSQLNWDTPVISQVKYSMPSPINPVPILTRREQKELQDLNTPANEERSDRWKYDNYIYESKKQYRERIQASAPIQKPVKNVSEEPYRSQLISDEAFAVVRQVGRELIRGKKMNNPSTLPPQKKVNIGDIIERGNDMISKLKILGYRCITVQYKDEPKIEFVDSTQYSLLFRDKKYHITCEDDIQLRFSK